MNYIWPIIIVISYIYAIASGNIDKINNSIYSSTENVIKLSMTLLGSMCLWCGIIKIIEQTKIMNFLIKILTPILNWLFPAAKNNKKAMDAISINTISNIIGIGNAATSSGLKAMVELQKENEKKNKEGNKKEIKEKNKLTKSMIMLVVLNTASIQILPTTVLAIRSSLGSRTPSAIILPIWISTIVGTVVGILMAKLMIKIK